MNKNYSPEKIKDLVNCVQTIFNDNRLGNCAEFFQYRQRLASLVSRTTNSKDYVINPNEIESLERYMQKYNEIIELNKSLSNETRVKTTKLIEKIIEIASPVRMDRKITRIKETFEGASYVLEDLKKERFIWDSKINTIKSLIAKAEIRISFPKELKEELAYLEKIYKTG